MSMMSAGVHSSAIVPAFHSAEWESARASVPARVASVDARNFSFKQTHFTKYKRRGFHYCFQKMISIVYRYQEHDEVIYVLCEAGGEMLLFHIDSICLAINQFGSVRFSFKFHFASRLPSSVDIICVQLRCRLSKDAHFRRWRPLAQPHGRKGSRMGMASTQYCILRKLDGWVLCSAFCQRPQRPRRFPASLKC